MSHNPIILQTVLRLLAVLGVCQWIVTTARCSSLIVLKVFLLSGCERSLFCKLGVTSIQVLSEHLKKAITVAIGVFQAQRAFCARTSLCSFMLQSFQMVWDEGLTYIAEVRSCASSCSCRSGNAVVKLSQRPSLAFKSWAWWWLHRIRW